MVNQQIQEFKILSLLGEGGMAKVYLAHDAKFDTNVAVKLLNVEYAHNENIRKRFLAEAKSMFRMSHPNIIKVTDLIDEQDTVAFVMEFVEGETLKDFIDRKRKLTDEEIVSVFSQMLDAVSYVHSRKLVHRDIKPSNFMVTPSGSVKLMDFGIAKNTDETSMEYTQTGTGMQMGTPMYMSPEQIRNTSEVTQSSDIYSLGIVLWQMVTGTKPYDTKTISSFDLQLKIVSENLPITNTRWDFIIKKATSKEVEHRFSDCSAFSKVIKEGEIIQFDTKNQEESIEKTVIEQVKLIEKKSNKAEKKVLSKNILNEDLPSKKIKWVIPVLVIVLVIMGSLYYFKSIISDENKFSSEINGNLEENKNDNEMERLSSSEKSNEDRSLEKSVTNSDEFAFLNGEWNGFIEQKEIKIVIQSVIGNQLAGYNIVGNNKRPVQGTVTKLNVKRKASCETNYCAYYNVILSEPGDHKWDGVFTLEFEATSIDGSEENGIIYWNHYANGVWKSYDGKLVHQVMNMNNN